MTLSVSRKALCLLGFSCFITYFIFGQNQKLADSLIMQYNSGAYSGNELIILREISIEETNPNDKLKFSESLIQKASKDSVFEFLQYGFLQKGNALILMGNNVKALKAYLRSLYFANRIDDEIGIGSLMISIADTYANMENFENSKEYYNKGILSLRKLNDSIKIGTALVNAGDQYFNIGKLDSALIYTEESTIIFDNINFPIGQAYSLGNLGMIYAEKGNDEIAEKNINEAINILEELEDYYAISVYLTYMSDIYFRKNDWTSALSYARRSLELAQKYSLKDQISDANLKLFELHQQKGNFKESIDYLQNYYAYRDSVLNIEAVEEMADLRTNYEVSQKQTEVDLLDQQKKNQQLISLASGIGLLLIIVVAIGLYRRNNFINKAKLLVENEKERSDLLLLNILPEQTAEELKNKGKVQAKRFNSVSVMFTDFKDFTAYSDKLSPEELVDSIDFYYSKFDDIIEKHGLEKIKTVGDAYMCAGGLPFPTNNHPIQMVEAALEIAEFVNESKKVDPDAMTRFDIRIGINTGPVVAGVVGKKKFAYDIWGDTVNIASRMESNSEPGKINISDNTYQLIKDQYQCSYRGELEAKNKGMMKMYFVEGILQNQTSNAAV